VLIDTRCKKEQKPKNIVCLIVGVFGVAAVLFECFYCFGRLMGKCEN